jgi:hypothetical protein
MAAMSAPAARLALAERELIRRSDYWRSGRVPAQIAGGKEWSHFCVLAPEADVLVNFSVVGGCPRLALLVRDASGAWRGDIETRRGAHWNAGAIGARFGASTLEFRDGSYQVEAQLAGQPLAVSLELRPLARPALTSSVALGAETMKWLVVPRLAASGTLRIGARTLAIANAPAYHDHDWGGFRWGGDFAWEWAIVLAELGGAPWTLIAQRITDRARHRVRSQGVLVWRGAQHLRTLHGAGVTLRALGRTRAASALRVPAAMRLAAPGAAADLPQRLEWSAAAGDDHIELALELDDLAQIALPNDDGLGATILTEARARARFTGVLRGEPISGEAPAIVEFNRAAA